MIAVEVEYGIADVFDFGSESIDAYIFLPHSQGLYKLIIIFSVGLLNFDHSLHLPHKTLIILFGVVLQQIHRIIVSIDLLFFFLVEDRLLGLQVGMHNIGVLLYFLVLALLLLLVVFEIVAIGLHADVVSVLAHRLLLLLFG